jgi:sulfate transport system ATP-binding protein
VSIHAVGIGKSFGGVSALRDATVSVESGTLCALLGPSGCGKSTLLRIIAGLEHPDAGKVLIDGRDVTDFGVGRRNIGFVFQNYALFPHLTVAQNVAFGLAARRLCDAEQAARVAELLELVHLPGYQRRRPHELSGGQRQRVALARALASRPSTLLLDEPFGALDLNVRKELRRALRELHDETHVTTVLVTHDADEALEIADRIVVLRDGTVQQSGAPQSVYGDPANAFVMRFLGDVNALRGEGSTVYVRPQNFRVETQPFASARPATIDRVVELGSRTQLELLLADGQRVVTESRGTHAAALRSQRGAKVYFEPTESRAFEHAV